MLVVCESPCSGTNGYGVSLSTFVAGWPREHLVQFYRSERLRDRSRNEERVHHAPVPGNPVLHALPYLRGAAPSWAGRFSRRWLENTLGGWRPRIIYSFFYSRALAQFSRWLGRTLDCPYILHVGDDDRSLTTGDADELRRIYAEARVRVAISHEMSQEYEQRYGLPFDVLHNGADDELFDGEPRGSEDGFVVRYVGSLLRIQHWNAIEDVCEAVKRLNAEGIRARFEIYCDRWTQKHAQALADDKYVFHMGFAAKPGLYELLRSADLLVLPAAFSGTGGYSYNLSMPTKLPEYLASGAPTLAYGPRGMASIELCLRNGIGTVVSERSVSGLTETMRNIANNRDEFRRKAAKDRAFTRANLSGVAAREHFRELIARALQTEA